MAALLTIPVIISIGDVSIYLSANDNALGVLFGARLASPKSALEIAMATDSMHWQYDGYPTDSTLRGTANYLLWLTGRYGQQAQYIISGAGGGTVIPISPSNPDPIQFIVDASTSYMIDGQSSKIITTFIGYNLLYTRGGIPQSTVNTESSYYSYDKTTADLVSVPAVATGELIQFYAIS